MPQISEVLKYEGDNSTFIWKHPSEDFNSLTYGIPLCWDNSEGNITLESYRWKCYNVGHSGVGLRFDSYIN